jgi:hypothetical protein
MIAGVSVLSVAVVVTLVFLLFRYCVPVRTWYSTRRQQHRDQKAARLGTAPSPWKWPLQFIFGSDRPAPPRRQQQQHPSEYYYHEKVTSYASNRDLEDQTSPGLVADGFRPPQATTTSPPEYKPYTPTSGNSWVANGWRVPLSHISQRLSNWPRRSGTARWFFGGGASRWSDSEASEANPRTTYSEGQLVDMYGAPTPRSVGVPHGGIRRSSISKSPLQVQVSQTEIMPSPPLPVHHSISPKNTSTPTNAIASPSPRIITTTIIKPPPAAATTKNTKGTGLGLTQTPIRPRASPRTSYLRSSVATTATSGTGTTALEAPPLPFAGLRGFGGQQLSHFSASTADPATPRRFVSEGLPKGGPKSGLGKGGGGHVSGQGGECE